MRGRPAHTLHVGEPFRYKPSYVAEYSMGMPQFHWSVLDHTHDT